MRDAARSKNEATEAVKEVAKKLTELRGQLRRHTEGAASQREVHRTRARAEAEGGAGAGGGSRGRGFKNPFGTRLAELEARAAALAGSARELEGDVAECDRELDRAQDEVVARTAEANDATAGVERLQARQKDALARQGSGSADRSALFDCSPALRAAIDRGEQRFRHKPIGPIGALLGLRDAKYAKVTELALSNVLEAFIVDNIQDRARLVQVARESNSRLGKFFICSYGVPGPVIAPSFTSHSRLFQQLSPGLGPVNRCFNALPLLCFSFLYNHPPALFLPSMQPTISPTGTSPPRASHASSTSWSCPVLRP